MRRKQLGSRSAKRAMILAMAVMTAGCNTLTVSAESSNLEGTAGTDMADTDSGVGDSDLSTNDEDIDSTKADGDSNEADSSKEAEGTGQNEAGAADTEKEETENSLASSDQDGEEVIEITSEEISDTNVVPSEVSVLSVEESAGKTSSSEAKEEEKKKITDLESSAEVKDPATNPFVGETVGEVDHEYEYKVGWLRKTINFDHIVGEKRPRSDNYSGKAKSEVIAQSGIIQESAVESMQSDAEQTQISAAKAEAVLGSEASPADGTLRNQLAIASSKAENAKKDSETAAELAEAAKESAEEAKAKLEDQQESCDKSVQDLEESLSSAVTKDADPITITVTGADQSEENNDGTAAEKAKKAADTAKQELDKLVGTREGAEEAASALTVTDAVKEQAEKVYAAADAAEAEKENAKKAYDSVLKSLADSIAQYLAYSDDGVDFDYDTLFDGESSEDASALENLVVESKKEAIVGEISTRKEALDKEKEKFESNKQKILKDIQDKMESAKKAKDAAEEAKKAADKALAAADTAANEIYKLAREATKSDNKVQKEYEEYGKSLTEQDKKEEGISQTKNRISGNLQIMVQTNYDAALYKGTTKIDIEPKDPIVREYLYEKYHIDDLPIFLGSPRERKKNEGIILESDDKIEKETADLLMKLAAQQSSAAEQKARTAEETARSEYAKALGNGIEDDLAKAQKNLENAQKDYDALVGIQNQAENMTLKEFSFAETLLHRIKEKSDLAAKAKENLDSATEAAKTALQWKAWAGLVVNDFQANSYAQIGEGKDEILSNEKGFDITEVASRDSVHFKLVEKHTSVPLSYRRAYVKALYEKYQSPEDVTSGKGANLVGQDQNASGAGTKVLWTVETNSEGKETLGKRYYSQSDGTYTDEEGKITSLPEGKYYLPYVIKWESDGYHIDGYYSIQKPADTPASAETPASADTPSSAETPASTDTPASAEPTASADTPASEDTPASAETKASELPMTNGGSGSGGSGSGRRSPSERIHFTANTSSGEVLGVNRPTESVGEVLGESRPSETTVSESRPADGSMASGKVLGADRPVQTSDRMNTAVNGSLFLLSLSGLFLSFRELRKRKN